METLGFKVVEIGDPSTKNKISFRFDEFNPRLADRRAPAARVFIDQYDGQGEFWLWMSLSDLKKNIKEFGPDEELSKAAAAYKNYVPGRRDFSVSINEVEKK